MPTAVCLLGSMRTLALDCTGATTMRRIARPLMATVFAFVNVPSEDDVVPTEALLERLAAEASVPLALAEVEVHRGSAFGPRPQARGLRRCWDVVGQPGTYDRIVRVRTDVYHGFVMPTTGGASTSVAYVGFLGAPRCSGKALWVDDRFAMLVGRVAQRLYLHDFANVLTPSAAPECTLGIVATNRVELKDVRDLVVNKTQSCSRAEALIVRGNCSEVRRAQWMCPIDSVPATLRLE